MAVDGWLFVCCLIFMVIIGTEGGDSVQKDIIGVNDEHENDNLRFHIIEYSDSTWLFLGVIGFITLIFTIYNYKQIKRCKQAREDQTESTSDQLPNTQQIQV